MSGHPPGTGLLRAAVGVASFAVLALALPYSVPVLEKERQDLRRAWRAAFLVLLAALVLVAISPLIAGHRPHGDAVDAPFLSLFFFVCCLPWVLLPIAVWPRSLSDLDGPEPVFTTVRGLAQLNLDRLTSVDCRTIWSRAGSVTYLSLRDADGGRVVVPFDRLEGTSLEVPLRAAVTRTDVSVTPRARQALQLPARPSLVIRARLCLESALLFAGVTLVVLMVALRVYVGTWWFPG
jgi:hypothetical protein